MSINASDRLKTFTVHNGDWEKLSWALRYVNVDGTPVPAAIWVKQLIKQFDYTYTQLAIWLQASADEPEWDCAIYAGFDSQGNAYIAARNEDVS